jgi:pyruvate ferredoxin oxidoreductase beta subunit
MSSLKFSPGGRTCAGCVIPLIVNNVLSQTEYPVCAVATGCLEVTSTIYPYNAWNVPCIHNAFENAASTIAGTEVAFNYKAKKGELTEEQKKIKFIAFAGDGGAYDIGFQAISGAFERGHDFTLVVYDNEGYQNTGGQRSAATPLEALTTTTPLGKKEERKNLTEILVAHKSPYVAQAAIHNLPDLQQKAKKAIETKGPTALIILAPCTTIWGFPPSQSIEVSRLAFETCFWPLYEVENGKYKINSKPSVKQPIEEFLRSQKRFEHILNDQEKIKKIQESIDKNWEELQRLEKEK